MSDNYTAFLEALLVAADALDRALPDMSAKHRKHAAILLNAIDRFLENYDEQPAQ